MDLKIEQGCPQCGAPVVLAETDRLLTCPFCGVKNFLQSRGAFRYTLPSRLEEEEQRHLIHTPFIRFKSNVFSVTEKGIQYRVIDTTQAGHELPGLPPSLGMRPQAMKMARVTPKTPGRFVRLSIKAKTILEKAILLSKLTAGGKHLFHRAFIGDTTSFIYLPLQRDETHLLDAIRETPLAPLERIEPAALKTMPFSPNWKVNFLPTLCPRCGWDLDGEVDSIVLSCSNCDTLWEISARGLHQVAWRIQPGDRYTAFYLAFWQITAQVSALDISSFFDFVKQTNLPMVPRAAWRDRPMNFLIPAFKLRPKIFLRACRQATASQHRLAPVSDRAVPKLFPVTLPGSEARQAVKICLAACATTPKNIFPYLPEARVRERARSLVLLPVVDRGHDWLQPETGTVVAKSVLAFGRTL